MTHYPKTLGADILSLMSKLSIAVSILHITLFLTPALALHPQANPAIAEILEPATLLNLQEIWLGKLSLIYFFTVILIGITISELIVRKITMRRPEDCAPLSFNETLGDAAQIGCSFLAVTYVAFMSTCLINTPEQAAPLLQPALINIFFCSLFPVMITIWLYIYQYIRTRIQIACTLGGLA